MNPKFQSLLQKSALFLSAIVAAQGATYYVSTTGSDGNAGSASAPFQHVSKGVAAATNPGDTVIVMNGTYGNEGVVEPNFVVTLNHSGAAGNPITIMAQNRGGAVLDSQNTSTTTTCNGAAAYFNLYNASFIVIQGFVIQNACDSGIQSNDAAHDITLRWNTIQYIANREVTDQDGRDGIYLNNSEYNFTFDGNIFHDIGRTSGVSLMQFDHGIYSHAQGMTIVNNVFYNMDRGFAIQIADGAANWVIANNTFSGPCADGGNGPDHVLEREYRYRGGEQYFLSAHRGGVDAMDGDDLRQQYQSQHRLWREHDDERRHERLQRRHQSDGCESLVRKRYRRTAELRAAVRIAGDRGRRSGDGHRRRHQRSDASQSSGYRRVSVRCRSPRGTGDQRRVYVRRHHEFRIRELDDQHRVELLRAIRPDGIHEFDDAQLPDGDLAFGAVDRARSLDRLRIPCGLAGRQRKPGRFHGLHVHHDSSTASRRDHVLPVRFYFVCSGYNRYWRERHD